MSVYHYVKCINPKLIAYRISIPFIGHPTAEENQERIRKGFKLIFSLSRPLLWKNMEMLFTL